MDVQAFSSMIGDLYRESSELNGWERFFTKLGEKLDFHSTSIMVGDSADRPVRSWGINIPQESEELFVAHYADIDPWGPALPAFPQSKFVATEQLYPDRKFIKTEIYNDFLRHDDVRRACGCYFDDPFSGQALTIALHRSHSREAFGCRELNMLDLVVPHIKNALTIYRRISDDETLQQSFKAIADITDCAAFVVDPEQCVVASNQQAERMFEKGEAIREGCRLRFKSYEISRAAQNLIDSMLVFTEGHTSHPCRFALVGGLDDGYQLRVDTFPLPADFLGQQRLGVLLLVKPMSAKSVISHAGLRYLFGLTSTESEVVRLLCVGHSVPEIAVQLKVKDSTIRSHVKGAYAKLGVSKQSELVTVVLASLASMP